MVDTTDPNFDMENLTDEQFEALVEQMPKRSQEEAERDLEEFVKHPLNCSEVTPEMLEQPEYQALQAMAYDGSPEEVAKNFLEHALKQLEAVLLKTSTNEKKDMTESLHCFD